ncbi:MAG: cardiolipin synthase [bacterium]
MELSLNPVVLLAELQLLLVIAISIRVIMNRPATGVALAWLVIVAVIPYFGAAAYLMLGERRISPRRMARLSQLRTDYQLLSEIIVEQGLTDVDWERHSAAAKSMATLGMNISRAHVYAGSEVTLAADTQKILSGIEQDINTAQKCVLMEFYIWHEGGTADQVLDAVIAAAARGVYCLVLVDAVGASAWWNGNQPKRLRKAGVHVQPALPVGLFRSLVGRTDLRLHRKIVIVDGQVGWTGSMNLVDPRFFKQEGGYGEWVDAMVRVEGTAVLALAAVMIGDWVIETGSDAQQVGQQAGITLPASKGSVDMQVIASGPGAKGNGLLKMMHAMIHTAQKEVIITTPYLVPDDSLLWALRGAVGRGVRVVIIVPKKVDSFMTRHASNSYLDGMLEQGMEICLYHGGLLHTKSITVDGEISMFGTVNLDMRSLWLNHEVSLFVYDKQFAHSLADLQQLYIEDSERLKMEEWSQRSFPTRFLENTMRLMSPLL